MPTNKNTATKKKKSKTSKKSTTKQRSVNRLGSMEPRAHIPTTNFYKTAFTTAPVRAYIPESQFIMSPYNNGLVPDRFSVDATQRESALNSMVKSLQQEGLSQKEAISVINNNLQEVTSTNRTLKSKLDVTDTELRKALQKQQKTEQILEGHRVSLKAKESKINILTAVTHHHKKGLDTHALMLKYTNEDLKEALQEFKQLGMSQSQAEKALKKELDRQAIILKGQEQGLTKTRNKLDTSIKGFNERLGITDDQLREIKETIPKTPSKPKTPKTKPRKGREDESIKKLIEKFEKADNPLFSP